jgi:CubicO group peptidase (beta-lactamase class C family)
VLGKELGYPVAPKLFEMFVNPYRVGSWSAVDQVPNIKVRTVQRPPQALALPRAAQPPTIRYRYGFVERGIADYLERQRATGLLVLKNGEIVAEHYRYGRKEDARFLSFSMAKSVTALLMGVAVDRGAIESLDDRADKYVTSLTGSAYGATTLRQLLRMSSGVTFSERYDGKDDVARLTRAVAGGPETAIDVLRSMATRHALPGQKFAYSSAETEVLGRVLASATKRSLAELTTEWLWEPMGAEHQAFWCIGKDGQEVAYGYFNASLRDWARLGLLLANDGRVSGQQVVSRDYLLDATEPLRQPEAFRPRSASVYYGYGYQFWLMPLRERTFVMQGAHGQALFVQPASGIVMVLTSVWEEPDGLANLLLHEERDQLWRGVLRSLGGSVD